jgi:nitroimidazol reductase NimA-like FMN-containing flavoprotein (pyridoxamine 5'-phosphate oxidase superfamily)
MSDAALESLTEDECLVMLQRTKYGRVAVVNDQGRPEIFPVNFVLHDRTVAFATASEVLQSWAPLGHVAFEADIIDPTTREGWDVVVAGEGADITDALDQASLDTRSDSLEHWAPGNKDRWISIVNPRFTGRRLYKPVPTTTFY